MTRLLQPLSYLKIRHKAKFKYDVVYPFTLAALSGTALLLVGAPLSGQGGLISKANNIVGILIGFYIAALAAVATFAAAGMDEPMRGDPPRMLFREKGTTYQVKLSRRVFLSQLFGFLTVWSLLTYAAGSAGELVRTSAHHALPKPIFTIGRVGYLYSYCAAGSLLFVNTLLGVYYLAFRIHEVGSRRLDV